MITLLTDFGLSDHYVAAMKGVILSLCPGVQIVDITHDITPYAIAEAAYTLSQAWRYFPPGTVHVAVVDPGVGSARRPILAEAGGHYFVGPDNGIFSLILSKLPERSVRHITSSKYFRHPVSETFHGRDIFSSVAAHLASGVPAPDFGPTVEHLALAAAEPVLVAAETWIGAVLHVDRFGNIITNFDWDRFQWVASRTFELRLGTHSVTEYFSSYSAASSNAFLIKGSSGYIEVSLNQRDAAKATVASLGLPLKLSTF